MSDIWESEDFKTKQELEKITKSKMNNFDYIKFKRFCTKKTNATKIRKEATHLGKIFIINFSDKVLISQIYKKTKSNL